MQETRVPQAIAERLSSFNIIERLALLTTGYTPDAEGEQQELSYYDRPVLKAPVWSWAIIWYFFFGGLAAGSYIIASIASLFGSRDDRAVARAGYYLSLLAVLPCPPLLIKDLGRPERFLNMFRMFKLKSPMSMGTWGLLTFSLFSGVTAVIQAARDGLLGRWWGARLLAALPQKLISTAGQRFWHFPWRLHRGALGCKQYSSLVAQQAPGRYFYFVRHLYQFSIDFPGITPDWRPCQCSA